MILMPSLSAADGCSFTTPAPSLQAPSLWDPLTEFQLTSLSVLSPVSAGAAAYVDRPLSSRQDSYRYVDSDSQNGSSPRSCVSGSSTVDSTTNNQACHKSLSLRATLPNVTVSMPETTVSMQSSLPGTSALSVFEGVVDGYPLPLNSPFLAQTPIHTSTTAVASFPIDFFVARGRRSIASCVQSSPHSMVHAFSHVTKRIGRPRIDRSNTKCQRCGTKKTPQWRYLLAASRDAANFISSPVDQISAELANGPVLSPSIMGNSPAKICLCNACWLRAHKERQRSRSSQSNHSSCYHGNESNLLPISRCTLNATHYSALFPSIDSSAAARAHIASQSNAIDPSIVGLFTKSGNRCQCSRENCHISSSRLLTL
eukprot:Gregarina_sp_Poly_1__4346@NODE_2355_length_2247_cov_271_432110_g1501_i0_p1_GENE_NODE_2355_length_2247_cov_271_432110_g1501_i0NODE_2355_length_2247_cov_271_432110_g1501_i0_p1_ORF_typecomplete_len370_score29_05GATA/PF00320_27/0_0088GATA/PF00320_27/0_028GATA/PF00320_27/6_7e03_NODE_2355_length_2247_cov_271_432110_g1501_i02271336